MKRAHPYLVQSSMEAAQGMAKAGVEFVPLPILSADDHCELADQMVGRLQRLAQMAETEADRVLRGQGKQATNRDRIEAIAPTNVIVHQYLQALRAGAVLGYHEALELMVLALAQKSDATEALLLELLKNDTRPILVAPLSSRYGTNSGHGHVWRRPDGAKSQCGGPLSCGVCASEIFEAERAAPGSVVDPAGEGSDKTMVTQFVGLEVVDVSEQQP